MTINPNHPMVHCRCECPCCGKVQTIVVREEDYNKWNGGVLIQDAFPYLSDDNREQMMTGICGPCFDLMFSDDDEPQEENEDNDTQDFEDLLNS